MNNKSETGKLGEDFACRYLEGKNYKIIGRNYREKFGEIDIIAKSSDGILIFFEIKTMRQYGNAANADLNLLSPEDQMTSAKIKKFKKISEMFAGKHQELIDDRFGWRLDLLSIDILWTEIGATPLDVVDDTNFEESLIEYGGIFFKIRHYKNI